MKKRLLTISLLSTLILGSGVALTSCNTTNNETKEDERYVIWQGLEDVDIQMGDEIPDLSLGVSAKDSDGKDLTVKLISEMSDDIDLTKEGSYVVFFKAFDGENAVDEDATGTQLRTIHVIQGTYIPDGGFDNGIVGWSGNGNNGSAMNFDYDSENKALRVNVTNSGNTYWLNQVEYNGLDVKKGVTYEISVKAKSTTGRNIGCTVEIPSQGYKVIESSMPNSVGLPTKTDEYNELKFYYTSDDNYTSVKLGFTLGRFTEVDDAPATVWLDDISMKAMDKKANSTGIKFTGETSYSFSSISQLNDAPEITAVDSNYQPVELTRIGSLPKEEYPSNINDSSFGEMWYYVDGDGNLSYFRRQFEFRR